MRIALVASPFLDVPPPRYGGTELFINDLAVHLQRMGIEVVVYTVGTSTVPVERRSFDDPNDAIVNECLEYFKQATARAA